MAGGAYIPAGRDVCGEGKAGTPGAIRMPDLWFRKPAPKCYVDDSSWSVLHLAPRCYSRVIRDANATPSTSGRYDAFLELLTEGALSNRKGNVVRHNLRVVPSSATIMRLRATRR